MTPSTKSTSPTLPFPISQISGSSDRYLIFDVDTITWLRKNHHILGVLIGTLPQIPQQNLFLSLPLELQPEEARLLVEKGLAYTVDDLRWHQENLVSVPTSQVDAFKAGLQKQGRQAAQNAEMVKQKRRNDVLETICHKRSSSESIATCATLSSAVSESGSETDDDHLFENQKKRPTKGSASPSSNRSFALSVEPWTVTPTTSYPPLPRPPITNNAVLPEVNPSSYALFHYLHSLGYYISPGLRFGCQFLVYPGDPLRYHSHFLAMSANWNEEINLLDLVGGGRLGTGVKKGWLLGGRNNDDNEESAVNPGGMAHLESELSVSSSEERKVLQEPSSRAAQVRVFCIEWAGM